MVWDWVHNGINKDWLKKSEGLNRKKLQNFVAEMIEALISAATMEINIVLLSSRKAASLPNQL